MVGERTMKVAVLMIPDQTSTSVPPLTRPAPIRPPIRAWELLLGSPKYQVMMFQAMAPTRAERMRRLSTDRPGG